MSQFKKYYGVTGVCRSTPVHKTFKYPKWTFDYEKCDGKI